MARLKAKAGGGYLIWLGIHWIDLVEHISGDRIREVCGFARNVGGQPIEVEDAAVLAVMFEKGMVGTHHSGYYLDRGYQSLIAIWGSQGWLRGPFDVTQNVPLEWYSTRRGSPRGPDLFGDDQCRGRVPAVRPGRGRRCQRRGRAPITSAEGLHVLKVVFGLYRAAETGSVQKIL